MDLNDLFHKDKMPLVQKPKYVTEKDGRRVYLWKRGLLENRLRLSQLGCTAVPSQQVLPSFLHISEKNEMYLQTIFSPYLCKKNEMYLQTIFPPYLCKKMRCICKHGKQIGMKSAKMHLPRKQATLSASSPSSTQKI